VEQHPTRATTQRVAHGTELGTPAIERAKIAREHFHHRLGRLAVAAHAREVQLVQDHGIHRNELLALQAIHQVTGRRGEIQRIELLGDRIEPAHGAAVVVLIVTLDQFERESVQCPGTAVNRFNRITHGGLLIGCHS
jgi:hypothetical protein